eukprot:CAMPEP_0117594456 /NCGR_PEP_ID=MMETSP0784-20121206/73212_1 /TAXON_ID=39447 /ORGANISM="" /LENGTH=172 /DNA_ID=CAMNT_0005396519 /DNA_START=347 /DNA_END=864 /DNA_ORIENTATION=+
MATAATKNANRWRPASTRWPAYNAPVNVSQTAANATTGGPPLPCERAEAHEKHAPRECPLGEKHREEEPVVAGTTPIASVEVFRNSTSRREKNTAQAPKTAPETCSCCCVRADDGGMQLARSQCKPACAAKTPQAPYKADWAALLEARNPVIPIVPAMTQRHRKPRHLMAVP